MNKNNIKNKSSMIVEVYDWIDTILKPIIIIIIIFTFLFQTIKVDGMSMSNTLDNNDRLILRSINYTPKQGDIVVVSRDFTNSVLVQNDNNSPIVKRIVALGGQTVDVKGDGSVFVDGIELNEAYVTLKVPGSGDPGTPSKYTEGTEITPGVATQFPYKVPLGDVFLMGDNRNNSKDSRFREYSQISVHNIIGQVVFRFYSAKTHSVTFQKLTKK